MMELDRQMRREIAEQVAMAVRDTLSKIEERWLTADELCQHFGMFNKEWLKEYGDTLPRERRRWNFPQDQMGISHARHQSADYGRQGEAPEGNEKSDCPLKIQRE